MALPKSFLVTYGTAGAVAATGAIAYVAVTLAPSFAPAKDPWPDVRPANLLRAPEIAAAPSAAVTIETAPHPTFDVVRVEPSGEAVVAGRAEPGARVQLLNRGAPVAEAKADDNGQFVMMPPPLPPGDHLLTLSASGKQGALESEQNVAMAVPRKPSDGVVAALAAPNEPTRVLSETNKPAGPPPTVAIRTAEVGGDGSFIATGLAPPGSFLRFYLNDALVAGVGAAEDGRWALNVNRGLSPGHYDLRADVVEPNSGKVLARAAAPFDFPAPLAERAKPGAALASNARVSTEAPPSAPASVAAGAAESATGSVVVDQLRTVSVVRGDSLWRISRQVYGQGVRYTTIYEANSAQIRDPNRIWPGQVFVAPRDGG